MTRRRRTPVLVLLLWFSYRAPLRAQDASMEGTVTNVATGQPISGAYINVAPVESNGPAGSAETDKNGRFLIEGLPPGRYTISASRPLFFRAHRNSGPVNFTLVQGQQLHDIHIQLAPTAVISGRVYDDNRTPMRLVLVEAFRLEYRNGAAVLVQTGQGNSAQRSLTDDRGEYRLFRLEPGTYYVRASLPEPSLPAQTAASYYPGVYDLDNATPIALEAGTEWNADISINPVKLHSATLKLIHGLVGTSGIIPPSVFVVRRGRVADISNVHFVERIGADNTFRISALTPGSYEVFARLQTWIAAGEVIQTGHRSLEITDRQETDIDAGSLSVHPTVTLSGHFINAANVRLDRIPVRVSLHSLDAEILSRDYQRAASHTTTNDELFSITGVSAGRFRIEVTGLPSGLWLSSASYGNRDVLDHELVIEEGRQESLELTLSGSDATGEVTGLVRNSRDEPLAEARVVLIPDPQRRENPNAFITANTDQLGMFSIQGVPPGDYTVLAWEDIDPSAYLNAETLKGFEDRGRRITVARGTHTRLDIHAIK